MAPCPPRLPPAQLRMGKKYTTIGLRNIDFLICGAGHRGIFLIKLEICEPLAGRDTCLITCCRRKHQLTLKSKRIEIRETYMVNQGSRFLVKIETIKGYLEAIKGYVRPKIEAVLGL